jgi:putative salt-induced outer membrane protein
MRIEARIAAALVFAGMAGIAHADWKGKGEAGMVFARGNTVADTINAKLAMADQVGDWKHSLDVAALRASTNGIQSANRYSAGWQSDYAISKQAFWFGGLRYENDKFSGFDYQASLSTGYGYKFYDTDKVKLSGQVGVGYRRMKEAPPSGATIGNAIAVGGFDYENLLTATTKVVDHFHVESGKDNTQLANFLGLEVKMSDRLALAVGIDVRDNTSPPPPKKKIDTVTTVNLVYAFGAK